MSTYTDYDNDHAPRATMYVSEEPRSFRVTYKGDDNKRFRVNIVQKPNPIGFTARLPGKRQSR